MYTNTSGGNWNTAIKNQTLRSLGDYNTALGSVLKYNTTGENNVGVGTWSLYSNTTGDYNTALGHAAGYSNTTGYGNTVIGNAALYSNSSGANNLAPGYLSMYSNTTGDNNLALDIMLWEATQMDQVI